MSTERVKCRDCDNMILPQTAVANGGICAQCVQVPSEIRQKSRNYRHDLASGIVFRHTEQELALARQPVEFGRTDTRWQPDPEYYAKDGVTSVQDAIRQAVDASKGNVFLVSMSGSRLNLSFTAKYGVCEYQNEELGDFLYAYSEHNLACQVPVEEHVVQACPCCGVGTFWYPSRFHMPRDLAFNIVRTLVANGVPADVSWLDQGDISHTSRGQG